MEIKELRDEILSTYEELKKRYDKQEEEIKNFGKASHETKTAIENLNKNLDELKSRLDEMETKMNRPPVGGEEHKADIMKKAFFRWVREGKAALEPEERKALVEDTAGQILVPEDLEKELYRELPKITVVRGLATVRPTTSNRIRRGSLTEVAVGWGKLETGAIVTDSMPSTPTEAFIYIEDLYGLAKIGEDELMDTDVNLQAYLFDSFSRKIAEAEDTAFIKGTGHANEQPEGILNTTVTRVTAGQPGAITVDDVLDLVYAVSAQYRKNSVFIMNSTTELAIRKLKDSNGRYLWQPAVAAGRPNTFLGYPIFNQEDVPEIPAAGVADDAMIFGDIKSGYAIFDRLGITIQRLNELYAESGLVGFKVHFRVGGGVARADALRILNVPAA